MMQKTRILTLLIILSTLCVMGCVEEIESEQYHKREIVVNCLLTDDSIQHLSLTYSNELGNTTYDEVKDATVSLYDRWGLVGTFTKTSYTKWQLKYRPWYGRDYKLVVEVPGKETVYAETTFPGRVSVKRNREIDTYNNRCFDVVCDKAYWVFAFDKWEDTVMFPPRLADSFHFKFALGTDNPYADDFNLLGTGDDHEGQHDMYIRMMPSKGVQSFRLFDLNSCLIVFRSVSDEYDKYQKSSLEKMHVFESFDDPTQWLDETVVYSNIHNGLGIFGAYSDVLINCNVSLRD